MIVIVVNGRKQKKWGGGNNFDVISPDEAIKLKDAVIALGNYQYRTEMRQQLLQNGYPEDRILDHVTQKNGWQYFDYFEPRESEIFVDAGCYNGHTTIDFIKWATKGYDYVYAFEASNNVIDNCSKSFKQNKIKGEIINKGLWNKNEILYFNVNEANLGASCINKNGEEKIETTTLDEVLNGKRATFIKMDIEGAEYKALLGAEKTIKKWNPRLAISIYHKPEDILEIPALLLDMKPDYHFALRQYRAHGSETILYAY